MVDLDHAQNEPGGGSVAAQAFSPHVDLICTESGSSSPGIEARVENKEARC